MVVRYHQLEEGEDCDNMDDDNNKIDPDTSLSYLDEKLHELLGHFQKNFESDMATANLGAKFGGYGTFLPTYERPSTVQSFPRSPQVSSSLLRSNRSPMEVAVQNSKAPLSLVSSSTRPGTVSVSKPSLHNVATSSVSAPVSPGLPVFSSQASEEVTLEDEGLRKPGNLNNKTSLKVRIKLNSGNPIKSKAELYSGNAIKSKAEIYDGLGLVSTPSSSSGDDPEAGIAMPSVSHESASESPSTILREMTSLPVAGNVLMSPLQENLLSLLRKKTERCSRIGNAVPPFEASDLGNAKKLNAKELKLVGKRERVVKVEHRDKTESANESTVLPKRTPEYKKLGKKLPSHNLKCTSLSNSDYNSDSAKGPSIASQISTQSVKDGRKGKLFSSDSSIIEESIKSKCAKGSVKRENQNFYSGAVEKGLKQRVIDSQNDNLVEVGDNESGRSGGASIRLKCEGKEAPTPKVKLGRQIQCHLQNETVTRAKERPPSKDINKPKMVSSGKASVPAATESVSCGATKMQKNAKGAGYGLCTSKNTINNSKLPKSIDKVRDNIRDLSCSSSDQLTYQMDRFGRGSGNKLKKSRVNDSMNENSTSLEKSQDRFRSKKVDTKLMSRESLEHATYKPHQSTENELTSQVEPLATNPTITIQDHWAQCDACETWRLLPMSLLPDQLPDKWHCSMQDWLPGKNHCKISEEETKQAVLALYQITPVAGGLHNLQTDGSATGVASVNIQNTDLDHQKSDFRSMSSNGERKYGLKEVSKAEQRSGIQGAKSTKNQLQESVKSKSLSNRNQLLVEPNVVKSSGFGRSSTSNKLVVEDQASKEKENHVDGGYKRLIKLKNRREPDIDDRETKKLKADLGETLTATMSEGVCLSNDYQNLGMDLGKAGLSSITALETKVSQKSLQQLDEESFPPNTNCIMKKKPLKLKISGKHSSDNQSMNWKGCVEKDCLSNKRKLEGNLDESDLKLYAKENKETEYRKDEKSRISKNEGTNSSTSNGKERSSKRLKVRQMHLSGSKEHLVDGFKEHPSTDKNQVFLEHTSKIVSEQERYKPDLFIRASAEREVRMAATSSLLKVSGSRKIQANLDEKKGSPEESVSSSPMRTSCQENLASARGYRSGKRDGVDHGVSAINYLKNGLNKSVDGVINQSGGRRNGMPKIRIKARPDNSKLVRGEVGFVKSPQCIGDLHAAQHKQEVGLNNCHENTSDLQKFGRDTSLVSKGSHTNNISNLRTGKAVTFDRTREQQELHSAKSKKFEMEVDNNTSGIKVHLPEKCGQADANHAATRDTAGERSTDLRMQTQSKAKEDDGPPSCMPGVCDTPKVLRKPLNSDTNTGVGNGMDHKRPELHGIRDVNAPSSERKDNPSQILKEAREKRDYADRLKSSMFAFESNEAYFQAAMMFLDVAALLETRSSENVRHVEMHELELYYTAAKLCESCAHEYERSGEMAAAALAYKCMEVAYFRIAFCKDACISRDRNELQTVLQMVSQGESPSSSASDVDNLNYQAAADKPTLTKCALSHAAGNHAIVARCHPSITRLVDYAHAASSAMEASRKSQSAFKAANLALGNSRTASVKQALDLSFQAVVELISLVRLAMKGINFLGSNGAKK